MKIHLLESPCEKGGMTENAEDIEEENRIGEAPKVCPACKGSNISDLGEEQILFPRYKCLDCFTLWRVKH